ncbi:hypothetical protein AQBE111736_01770 [Aquirufa beregesia]
MFAIGRGLVFLCTSKLIELKNFSSFFNRLGRYWFYMFVFARQFSVSTVLIA